MVTDYKGAIVLTFIGISKIVGILVEEELPQLPISSAFTEVTSMKVLVLKKASLMVENITSAGVDIGTVFIGDMSLPSKGVIILPLDPKSPYNQIYCKSLGIIPNKIIVPEMKMPLTVM